MPRKTKAQRELEAECLAEIRADAERYKALTPYQRRKYWAEQRRIMEEDAAIIAKLPKVSLLDRISPTEDLEDESPSVVHRTRIEADGSIKHYWTEKF